MWVGTEGDLQRLLTLMEQPYERLLDGYVEEKTSHALWMVRSAEEELAYAERMLAQRDHSGDEAYGARRIGEASSKLEKAKAELAEETRESRLGARLRLTVSTDGKETRRTTGTARELAEYLRGRTFRQFEIEAPSGSIRNHDIVLNADVSDGVRIRVDSTDATWATATFADLEAAVRARVPRWSAVRGSVFLYFFLCGSAWFVLWNLLQVFLIWVDSNGELSEGTSILLYVGVTLWALLIGIWATNYTKKRMPAFEIIPPGEKGKGRALFGAVGGALGAVVLGALTNVLTLAFTS